MICLNEHELLNWVCFVVGLLAFGAGVRTSSERKEDRISELASLARDLKDAKYFGILAQKLQVKPKEIRSWQRCGAVTEEPRASQRQQLSQVSAVDPRLSAYPAINKRCSGGDGYQLYGAATGANVRGLCSPRARGHARGMAL